MHCNNCGKELGEDAVFCPQCGAKVKDEVTEHDLSAGKEKGDKKKKLLIIAGIVICVFAIGLVVFLSLNSGKREDDKQEAEVQDREEETEEFDESEYIFPYSDKEYLTDADVENLTEEQLGFARNEIIARHGRIYTDDKYKTYFESKSWYEGTVEPEAFDADYENQLNEIEKANIEIIKKYEERFQINALAEQYYAGILKEYQDAEAGGYSGSESQYPHVNPILHGWKSNMLLHYALIDLCGDGTPELFIGYPASGDDLEYTILDMYGYADGKAEKFMDGVGLHPEPINNYIGEHEKYYICDNLMIKKEETNGESRDATIFYRIEENSAVLLLSECVTRTTDGYYWSDDGLSTSEVTEEQYENTRNKYAVKKDIPWHKLADLKLENNTDTEESFDAKVCYEQILQQYRAQKGMLMTGGDDDFTETYPNVNMNVFGGVGEIPEGLGYAMIDIDGNGVEELFIADVTEGTPASYTTYDIYTCVQGTPRRLFDAGDMGIQSFYFISENNVIMKIQKENDSTWYGTLFYQITGDYASTNFVDGVWIYPGSNLGPMYFRSEECMADDSEGVDKAYYDTLLNTYPVKEDIEWIKL